MNNSPVTPLPLYTRILDTEREEIATTDSPGLNRHRGRLRFSQKKKKKNGHLSKEKKKNISQVWIKTLISWSMARSRAYVFQEHVLENLPLVALQLTISHDMVSWTGLGGKQRRKV